MASRVALLALTLGLVTACGPTAEEAFHREYHRGQEAQRAGRNTDAIAAYGEAVKVKPSSADAHNALGAELYEVGQSDAAMQEYRRALEINPELAAAHNNLGVALLAAGQVASAVGAFREAVEISPNFIAADYNLCLGLELLGQLQDALQHCRAVQRTDPKRPGVAAAVERLEKKLAEE